VHHRVTQGKFVILVESTVATKAISAVSRRGAEFAVNTLDFGFSKQTAYVKHITIHGLSPKVPVREK
jgi:hypothetical protein